MTIFPKEKFGQTNKGLFWNSRWKSTACSILRFVVCGKIKQKLADLSKQSLHFFIMILMRVNPDMQLKYWLLKGIFFSQLLINHLFWRTILCRIIWGRKSSWIHEEAGIKISYSWNERRLGWITVVQIQKPRRMPGLLALCVSQNSAGWQNSPSRHSCGSQLSE